MKKIKYLIVFSLSLICIHFYGMKRAADSGSLGGAVSASAGGGAAAAAVSFVAPPSDQPLVEAFFVPEDNILSPLFTLLNNAQRQVLVAMYWITYPMMVDKLISLKQRGVDVKIIFDVGRNMFMDRFLENDIVPIIFASDLYPSIMHNKFVVVDDTAVLTGSANFTQQAFNPTKQDFNFENIVVLRLANIVQRYRKAFFDLETDIYNQYFDLIVHDPSQLPDWFRRLVPILYSTNEKMPQLLESRWNEFDQAGQQRLQQFFGLQMQTQVAQPPVEPPTQKQQAFLRSRGRFDQGMSKQQATVLIGRIIAQERGRR